MRERYQIEEVRVKHRALVGINNKRVREKSKAIVGEAKRTGCMICPEDDPTCLVFHHLDPSQKILEVGKAVADLWNEEKLRAEIAKCIILCSNCHHKVHAGVIDFVTDSTSFAPATKKPPRNHKQALAQKRQQRNRELASYAKLLGCELCYEKEASCLVFHHRDPQEKESEIANAIRSTWSKERLLDEICKCVVLCANCHSKLHAGVIELYEGDL